MKGDALANALMKAETKAKRRVTLSLAGLGWLDETEIASIPDVRIGEDAEAALPEREADPEARRISRDQARELKQLAQTVYGYRAGEERLRQDLGFEVDERLTLRHLAAHVSAAQYQALVARYEAALREAVEADVP